MISIDDRMAIMDLCSRYNYYVDTGAAERWADTFTADGVFENPDGRSQGRDELITFAVGFAKQYPGAMHFTDNHLFEQDGDVVKHKCFLSFQIPSEGPPAIALVGYEDKLVQVDGEWKFSERLVGPLSI